MSVNTEDVALMLTMTRLRPYAGLGHPFVGIEILSRPQSKLRACNARYINLLASMLAWTTLISHDRPISPTELRVPWTQAPTGSWPRRWDIRRIGRSIQSPARSPCGGERTEFEGDTSP